MNPYERKIVRGPVAHFQGFVSDPFITQGDAALALG
jgi:hypothetical protein